MENLQDLQKKRIEKSFSELYGLESVTENTFEKGGEGSRGGKVIGHTKSGKPVYEDHNSNHKDYKDFSKEDHSDAADLHHSESMTYGHKNESKFTKHLNKKDKHLVSAGKPGHWKETRQKQGLE